jgi:transposase
MMDKLHPQIDNVKKSTFNRMTSLFPHRVNLVLFDVTTLYFETPATDELRARGYGKECRFNTSQVVLALATNEDGLPIGYELFAGNKAEVKTLLESIEHWKTLFNIGSVCFVGDRAMFSDGNLTLLEEKGYNYVIAAKLRKLPGPLTKQILHENNYKATILKNDLAWVGEFEHNKRRLIVSYKKKRAIKDAKDRQKQLDKIKKLIDEKGSTRKLLTNGAIKKYTTSESSTTIIDEDKIAGDALWDGLHGVITNIKTEASEHIIMRYARLWIIEESFRINKHLLKMRPIFHRKLERIHTHIAICYMTFAVLRHLQYRVQLTQKISPAVIIEELQQVESSIYVHKKTGDLYRVPGKFTNNARKIYKAFSIDRPLDAAIYI